MVDRCPTCGSVVAPSAYNPNDDPQLRELCEMLNRFIVSNGYKPASVTKSAMGAMDRLMRIDGHSYELIVQLMEWSQADEFWLHNIRSPQKLRKHFDTMLGQMRKQQKPLLEQRALLERQAKEREERRAREAAERRRTEKEAVPMPSNNREVLKRGGAQ